VAPHLRPGRAVGLTVQGDGAGRGRALSGQRLHQLGLAVARHAGDPDDLAAPDPERNVVHRAMAAVVVDGEAAQLEPDAAPGAGVSPPPTMISSPGTCGKLRLTARGTPYMVAT
jgi:hypothetical protein